MILFRLRTFRIRTNEPGLARGTVGGGGFTVRSLPARVRTRYAVRAVEAFVADLTLHSPAVTIVTR